ncbi:DUF4148 domain-containing protein [Burkholderia cepacia]|uniref:DUF4148 domain-containing protein n=1 Tax=Burkholderia cepacia TaxID=292 RepID=UPI0009C0AAEA|nr:DUF4148 domain-containing protein [Burkholderia cepacia]
MTKSRVRTVIVLTALAIPMLSFAQADQPLTRAQVRKDLVQLEKNGYEPSRNDPYYPDDIQAAEARMAKSRAAEAKVEAPSGDAVVKSTSNATPQAAAGN